MANDSDHASLFFMSPLVIQDVTTDGQRIPAGPETWARLFPGSDKHRVLATNIYETKDGKFYHTHGETPPLASVTWECKKLTMVIFEQVA